ncbi:MAG TPA: hypothetical protein VN654_22785 [Vicinamibacterales bacterium]|jgi:hypothetical protein|nr:hypothetical protein [Vicinamibacterales bacterium]
MDRYDATRDPKNPPNSVTRPPVASAVLLAFVGSLVAFFVLVGAALLFWTVAHPRPAFLEQRERAVGASGYYSTEGGHLPIRRPSSTSDELTYRGKLTPPSEARGR